MDIRQLRYFHAVAQHGNVSHAAANLNVAQPAISRHIKQLESELGVVLMTRHARGISLTDAGERLLQRASNILREAELVRLEAASSSKEPVGGVAVAVLPTLSILMGGPLIEYAARFFPGISIDLREGFSGHCLSWLLEGSVDMAFLYNVEHNLSLRTLPLFNEPVCLIGSHQIERPRSRSVSIAEAAGLDLILPSRRNGLRQLLDTAAERSGNALKPKLEIDAFELIKYLVIRNIGYSILPFSAVAAEVAAGKIWTSPLADPEVVRSIDLAYRSDRPSSTAAHIIRDTILHSVAHSSGWPKEIEIVADAVNRRTTAGP